MKVIIDLIEDIQSAINSEKSFSLSAMCVEENENSEFRPLWQNNLCNFQLDEEKKVLFLFLGQEDALNVGDFLEMLHTLENKTMMHEIKISYSKEGERVDASLIGFSELLEEKKYLLLV